MAETEVDYPAGPVADRLTLWPVDDGQYGLNAVYQGAQDSNAASRRSLRLKRQGPQCQLLQNMDNSWSLRFGPLTA